MAQPSGPAAYDALMQAGAAHGLGHVGMRAMDSMRLEKSYRAWGTDLNAENTALEAGLDRFVRLNKAAFTGREALIRQQQAGIPNTFCTIEIDAENAVSVIMTLTAPGCPVAGEMPGWVADAIEPLPGVKQVDVDLTWEPQWGMDMMSDEARLELGFM